MLGCIQADDSVHHPVSNKSRPWMELNGTERGWAVGRLGEGNGVVDGGVSGVEVQTWRLGISIGEWVGVFVVGNPWRGAECTCGVEWSGVQCCSGVGPQLRLHSPMLRAGCSPAFVSRQPHGSVEQWALGRGEEVV